MKQQQQQIEAEVRHTLACELCAPDWIICDTVEATCAVLGLPPLKK